DPTLVSELTTGDGALRRFLWEHRFLFVPLEELEQARSALERRALAANPAWVALEDDTTSEGELDRLRERLRKAEQEAARPGEIVSSDGRTQLLIVQATFPSTDSTRSQQLLDQVQAAIAEVRAQVGPKVAIGAAGDIVPAALEHRAVLGGMVV